MVIGALLVTVIVVADPADDVTTLETGAVTVTKVVKVVTTSGMDAVLSNGGNVLVEVAVDDAAVGTDAFADGMVVELLLPSPHSCGIVSTVVTGLQPGRLVKFPETCSGIGSGA